MMKSTRIRNAFFVLGAVMATHAWTPVLAAEQPGTDFRFSLRGDYFKVDVRTVYAVGKSTDEIRRIYKDTSLFPQFSDLVTRMEQRGPDAAYQLRATATKWGFSQTNASNCQDSQPASGAWNQDCTLAIGVADTGKYFLSGGAFVHCSVIDAEAGQVACIQHSEGQPKPIHIPLIITRTPQQLGVAGAGQLIRDYGVQREYVNGAGSPRAAGQQYEGSYLQGLQNRLFNEGRARIDAGEVSGSRTLTILGSDRTRTFTVDVK